MSTTTEQQLRSPQHLLIGDEPYFKTTVRDLLRIFGYERRKKNAVTEIQDALNEQGLFASPQFDQCDIDWEVSISKTRTDSKFPTDPFTRIKIFLKRGQQLLSVKREDTIEKAITIMLQNDYSQLPVFNSDRKIDGVICWRTIGRTSRLTNRRPSFVREVMEEAVVVNDYEHLDNVIAKILSREYVLVKDAADHSVKWILTQEDIGRAYQEVSEGYLTIKDIESFLRTLIHRQCSVSELLKIIGAVRNNPAISTIDDLYFSDYVHILSTDEVWKKTGLPIDRNEFVKLLSDLVEVRNSIMHFRTPAKESEKFESLRKMKRLIMSLELYTSED